MTLRLTADKLTVEVSEEAEVSPSAGLMALVFGADHPAATTTQEESVSKQPAPKQQPVKGPPAKPPKQQTPSKPRKK